MICREVQEGPGPCGGVSWFQSESTEQAGQDMRQETGQDDPYDEICNACMPFCGLLLHELSSQTPWQDARRTELLMPNPFHYSQHFQGQSESEQLPQETRSHPCTVGYNRVCQPPKGPALWQLKQACLSDHGRRARGLSGQDDTMSHFLIGRADAASETYLFHLCFLKGVVPILHRQQHQSVRTSEIPSCSCWNINPAKAKGICLAA